MASAPPTPPDSWETGFAFDLDEAAPALFLDLQRVRQEVGVKSWLAVHAVNKHLGSAYDCVLTGRSNGRTDDERKRIGRLGVIGRLGCERYFHVSSMGNIRAVIGDVREIVEIDWTAAFGWWLVQISLLNGGHSSHPEAARRPVSSRCLHFDHRDNVLTIHPHIST